MASAVDLRSFGQLIGHVADSHYLFCSAVLGKSNPAPGIEKSKTTRADLVLAVKDAFACCGPAYDALIDAQAAALVNFFGGDQARVTVLAINTAHRPPAPHHQRFAAVDLFLAAQRPKFTPSRA